MAEKYLVIFIIFCTILNLILGLNLVIHIVLLTMLEMLLIFPANMVLAYIFICIFFSPLVHNKNIL